MGVYRGVEGVYLRGCFILERGQFLSPPSCSGGMNVHTHVYFHTSSSSHIHTSASHLLWGDASLPQSLYTPAYQVGVVVDDLVLLLLCGRLEPVPPGGDLKGGERRVFNAQRRAMEGDGGQGR